MTKTGCIIQGNIRTKHINLIVNEMIKHFDRVVVSTWIGEKITIDETKCKIIYNSKPINSGLSNRNLQRLSVVSALRYLKNNNVEFVLKWRTDMLPTKMDVNNLIKLANQNLNSKIKSRIVMPAFRNLSVNPDYLSSFPDHFAFGHIDEIELLWGDEKFDYAKDYNFIGNEDTSLIQEYNAHSELYLLYKNRIMKKTNENLLHPEIVTSKLYLIDLELLKICWFKNDREFRSIKQAYQYPWWTESGFKKNKYKMFSFEEKPNFIIRIYYLFINYFQTKTNTLKQWYWFSNYRD
jgi:hypothetical protein